MSLEWGRRNVRRFFLLAGFSLGTCGTVADQYPWLYRSQLTQTGVVFRKNPENGGMCEDHRRRCAVLLVADRSAGLVVLDVQTFVAGIVSGCGATCSEIELFAS